MINVCFKLRKWNQETEHYDETPVAYTTANKFDIICQEFDKQCAYHNVDNVYTMIYVYEFNPNTNRYDKPYIW